MKTLFMPDTGDGAQIFEPGVYQHSKGGLSRALFLAKIEHTPTEAVVFVSLQDGSVWTRPLEGWTDFDPPFNNVPSAKPFEPGVYLHFKGGKYGALFLAKDSQTLEDVVVYVHLHDGSVWIRSLERWCEYVQWPNGKTNPRFLKIP